MIKLRWYTRDDLTFPHTVKLGYNELGYKEHSVITNKNIYLVGLGHF